MAREGGPDAVVLREATRRTGVSPNAAYRHFSDRDALVAAVSDAASAASAAAIEAEWDAVAATDPPPRPRTRTSAQSGSAICASPATSPGCSAPPTPCPPTSSRRSVRLKAGPSGRTPFQLLDRSRSTRWSPPGSCPPNADPARSCCAWSAVHGLAMLVLEGPLRDLDEATLLRAGQQLIDMVDRGL